MMLGGRDEGYMLLLPGFHPLDYLDLVIQQDEKVKD